MADRRRRQAEGGVQGFLPDLHRQAVRAFAPLGAEFGLSPLPESAPHPRENSVSFRNAHVRVDLTVEAGGRSFGVALARYDPASGEPRILGTCPLAYFLRRRRPEAERALDLPGTPTGPGLAAALGRIAGLLRDCAGDALAGDFAAFAEVRAIVIADRRADLVRRFGTSTGETPRFDRRPSLFEQLGGPEGGDAGLRAPRAYQAVHDYGYSPAEVAAFFGVSEAEVLALLAEWETTF